MAAPATSLFSQLTRLTHTKTHKHALSGVPNVPLTLTDRQTDRHTRSVRCVPNVPLTLTDRQTDRQEEHHTVTSFKLH